ncbi:MAG: transglutaminase domain-containing protein [Coprococcus sp.]
MKKYVVFLKGIILICILTLMFGAGRWIFFNIIKHDSILDGLVSFREAVIDDMESGKDTAVYYVRNVKKSDVHMINQYIDSAYGNVNTYRVIVESGDYLAIQLDFELSDNYYVIRKYLYNEEIPSDRPKAEKIYDVIKAFIDANITIGMTDFDKEIAVHDFIVKNCAYGYPENKDDAYTAYGVLVSHTAVCDGYAEAFFMFMSCLGIECDIVVGDTSEGLHAWNMIKLDDEWYHIDLTWDDSLPDMGAYVKHVYVNLDDKTISQNHTWEEQFYNKCTSEKYNFYKKKFYYYSTYDDYKSNIKIQLGKSNVLEAGIEDVSNSPDLSFLFNQGGIRKINYVVEDMGYYKVLVVYLNK